MGHLVRERLLLISPWHSAAELIDVDFFEVGRAAVDPSTRLLRSETYIRIAHPTKTPTAIREGPVSAFVSEACHGYLFEVVLALSAPRRLARGLNRRQEKRDKDADDRDDDEK